MSRLCWGPMGTGTRMGMAVEIVPMGAEVQSVLQTPDKGATV